MSWGDQIWAAIEDLREAGVENMVVPEIGWKVEVANYPGTYPHSHTKFVVVDGERLMAAGFNYGWLHYPREHPSGEGDDLTDLGIIIEGPVAQAALATYDDMWVGADQIYCSDFYPQDGSDWKDSCVEMKASGGHPPEVMKYYLAGSETTLSLYRTHTYKEADEAVSSAIASAKETIDIMSVNFSLEVICMVNVAFPDACTFKQALPWMESLVEAIETNQVYVRAIVENANSNGLENRVGIDIFEKELARRGLSEYFEVRFFDGRLHAKSILIDDVLLIVGSQNLHYSSYGKGGLLEYSVATDSPEAIQTYQEMFEYYWDLAIPADEAEFATTAN
jgi:phosphatidylserine/phosphatidylglycerophosphate/cardiolipin synthase-like enzyme